MADLNSAKITIGQCRLVMQTAKVLIPPEAPATTGSREAGLQTTVTTNVGKKVSGKKVSGKKVSEKKNPEKKYKEKK